MTKTIVSAALVSLVLWGTATYAQEQPFSNGPGDLFAPPRSPTPLEAESSAPQTDLATVDIAEDAASGNTPVFYVGKSSKHSERIEAALNAPITNAGFNFTETPLSEIANFLRDEYQIEVQLDLQALDDLGLSPDDTITTNIRHVSLASALKLMLKQHDLTYMIADEVLLITSEDECLARLSVRVYPVGDLLQPKEGLGPATASVDDLIDGIISTIASDTWSENGGGEAEIRPLQPGLLIISQTQAVHEEIAHLLAALRRARQHELAMPYALPAKEAKKATGGGGFGGGRESPAEEKPEQKQEQSNPGARQGGGAF